MKIDIGPSRTSFDLGVERPSGRAGSSVRRGLEAAMLAATLFLGACGDSDPVTPDPAVEPFVGDWDALEFDVTSAANPGTSFDVAANGSFTINIQPSGHYTAILEIDSAPTPNVEMGRLEVSGTTVILDPNEGPSATATFTFETDDLLVLEGPTEFDFNFDGEPEPAEVRMVLERR